MENKVTYGLKNVHVAPITNISTETGVLTYGDIFRFPGAMEITLEPKGESGSVDADDIVYHFMNANEGYEGKWKVAHIIEQFATKILGEIKDTETGVLTETGSAEPTPFALMFEFSGDKNNTRHVLYYCSASRPATGSKTKSGTSVNDRELSFNASPRPRDSVIKRSVTSNDKKEVYDNWFKKVYEPAAVSS
ncbi:TPA: major tail protein [Streptococcus suis]